jgi:hypothetical protein
MKFTKLNLNPKGRKTGDCVVRAIAKGMDQSWEDTLCDLHKVALHHYTMPNDKFTYDKYLTANGWTKEKMPRFADNTRYTVKEFIAANPHGTFILSVANHLTVAINGELFDTWNCGSKSVGNYWTI